MKNASLNMKHVTRNIFKIVIGVFILWKILDPSVSLLVGNFIPYLGFFPYKEILLDYKLPQFLYSFANFDGAHYLIIASKGYFTYTQAFFPLYSLLIKLLTFITHNGLLSGLLISNICFLLGLFVFYKYVSLLINEQVSEWEGSRHAHRSGDTRRQSSTGGKETLTESASIGNNPTFIIVFLLLFPTSFFFGSVYTEGLFFLLFIGTLYFTKKQNYLLASVCGFLASLTKLTGIFLIIPILFSLIKKNNNQIIKPIQLTTDYRILATILSPIVGFLLYAFYLWKTTGDPLFFFHSQPAFGANRSTSFIFLPQVYYRYFRILFTANHDYQYFIALLEVSIFTLVLGVLLLDLKKNWKNYERLGLNLFSMANLVLPTLTGTFSSVPRYALLSISFFLFLGEMKNKYIKIFIGLVFFLLHILLLGFFIQGYFVS